MNNNCDTLDDEVNLCNITSIGANVLVGLCKLVLIQKRWHFTSRFKTSTVNTNLISIDVFREFGCSI